MLHREDQIQQAINTYDIVKAKTHVRAIPGAMNSYSKSVQYKEFQGYGLVIGSSENYANVYFPNRETKLIKKSLIKIAIKF